MAKREVKTDLWVYDLLKEAGICLDPQGCSIKEVDEALKTASKKGTGNVGFPEYVGVVKDFLLVIEDKSDLSKHVKYNEKDLICTETKSVTDYAVNGAYFYGKHLINNTHYKKIIAFGVSGNEKHHKITPLFINEREYCKVMPDVESFYIFNEENIEEYYTREVLGENTDLQKETTEILKFAKNLHEDLRNYGNLQDTQKPLVVSGILLALREIEKGSFNLDQLNGDDIDTDGNKIYAAIDKNLQRSNVSPTVKKDKLLTQFAVIKDTKILNEKNKTLGKTPLKYYAEQIYDNIYKTIKYTKTAEDYLGRFYGEFMSYSGGDGQTLGIILTPKHITQLFCDLIDLKPEDVVLDPCCGTAGFLIAAMHNMLKKAKDENQKENIRKNQLHGIELQPYMFTIATSNMIIRGDGKSNLVDEDFLRCKDSELQLKGATVGMMNPPYSQGSKANPSLYEISFVEHLLDSLAEDGKAIVIIPQSSLTGKTKDEQNYKESILKHHTLEGVITLSGDTFYGVGTNPCIAIFTAHKPHPANKECKFIDFKDDGFKVAPHIGLVETEYAKDKKQHLLDVWFDRIEAPTKFCVKSTVEVTDEWLHAFYYFNDEIPTEEDFDKTIADYLTFEFSMIAQGRSYLFKEVSNE
ncbi:TPA: SAM-dependent methyltransferase [Candidatus Gastranaerophilales bacterium HUM_10]|nr:MAG TPA: SAM-dependent methyltransferase [Candidatus Gastranaerophilales bacterium HUM_10]